MKFTTNTVSKPVVGKEAKALSKVLASGQHLTNKEAHLTVERIAQRRISKRLVNANGAN
jgi:hypothetical protein